VAQLRSYFVYIMTNHSGTLYTGVTGNLTKRVYQHRIYTGGGFTARYELNRLIWYQATTDVMSAISREKDIKGWVRSRKLELIREMNPKWIDLAEEWLGPAREQAVGRVILEGGLPRPGVPPFSSPINSRRVELS